MKKILSFLLLATLCPATVQAQDIVCGALENHIPDADVSHRPNDDVNLNNPNVVPEIIKVPLTVDLAQRVASLTGTQLEAPFGMVEIHQDGRVLYNGENWTSSIMKLCGKSHAVTTMTEISGDGILNQKKILNTGPVINRIKTEEKEVPAEKEPVRPAISKKEAAVQPAKPAVEDNSFKTKPAGYVSKAQMDVVEVAPTVAIPPQDVPEPPPVKERREPNRVILSDMIEGGDYREIYYNE